MNTGENEKMKAAYALNLWTVSISQIIEYNDINIARQEYETIMENLNLENMPKDETLLDVIKEILDEVTYLLMEAGDRLLIEKEYRHQIKNAIWSAVPNMWVLFNASNIKTICISLATQVGIGYMNYRRNKAEYSLAYEKSEWQLQRNRIEHLNGLQKQLFETAWRLADAYEFPDEYRLTPKQISDYNKSLMETNPVKRYNCLDAMKPAFTAYPAFWYQIGSTANSIYRSSLYASDKEIQDVYRSYAIECFEKYYQLNKFNLLKHDVLTSSWALEYLELLDLNQSNDPARARELIQIAEKYSGNALDILELCAFAYLRIKDLDNAIRLFLFLVNEDYNAAINTQILSGLYIKWILEGNSEQAKKARIGYKQLPHITNPKYILKMPPKGTSLSQWKPAWNREENWSEFLKLQQGEEKQKKEALETARKKAMEFYQQSILLVSNSAYENIAEYFLSVLNENRKKLNPSLPSPSRCSLKDYKRNREEIERTGTHVIMVGDSEEAQKFYKNVKGGRWDYYKLGMRYVSYGNKTVLLARTLKNEQINELISLAEEVNQKHPVKIPSNAKTIEYKFMKEKFEGKFDSPMNSAKAVINGLVTSPLLIAGQLWEEIRNEVQLGKNLISWNELKFLQYHIAIYQYLKSENAMID